MSDECDYQTYRNAYATRDIVTRSSSVNDYRVNTDDGGWSCLNHIFG